VLQLDSEFSHEADTALLQQVAAFAAANLRGGDLVFVCGTTTLVCLLADGNENAVESVRDRLLAFHVTSEFPTKRQELCAFRSAIVRAPRDGKTLAELLSAAEGIFASISPPIDIPRPAQRRHG
jgi:GGDEF domain-containing protein